MHGGQAIPARRLRSNDACWCGSKKKLKRCHGDHESFRRAPIRPGTVSPMLAVPDGIEAPYYVGATKRPRTGVSIVTDPAELVALERASRLAAQVLQTTGAAVRPGVTTDELDAVAHQAYLDRGTYPSTRGYGTYTKSICTSVNEVVCHGIPDDRPLQAGDIVNVDVTAFVDGFHGDTSATFLVGEVDEPTRALVETARAARDVGISAVRPGKTINVIGRAIQHYAHQRGYGVVSDYGGHGIGREFHAAPHIFHVDTRGADTVMVPGMVFTIEPMLNAGVSTHTMWDDGWTVVTEDGLPSAQFEHTVIVTEDGARVLTLPEG
ncbi:MAG: type I methionyl aminopeptidase [Ilumatobacteraceae bacterium]